VLICWRMPLRSPTLLRWLRIACALLALVGGEGLHEVTHRADWGPAGAAEAPSGQLEIHSGDCPHRQDVHEPHTHACLACKAGHEPLAPLVAMCGVPAAQRAPAGPATAEARHAPSAAIPGTLGARGPPATTA
jgi:hypothetical protein